MIPKFLLTCYIIACGIFIGWWLWRMHKESHK